jgi:D-tyrosyl-tRNA(Tyr) deacylase
MKVVVQRASNAKCVVDGKITGEIEKGLMVLVGFTDGDNMDNIEYMCRKISNLRIFDDQDGVMNKSILDVGGSVLSISQFTLYGDAIKGNRPSYIKAMKNDEAKKMYELFNQELRKYVKVEEGIFGADMHISFTNDGPVTIIIER